MVKPKQPKEETMAELLKPFHARAALAEVCLALLKELRLKAVNLSLDR